jgi:hypothetical protein
MLEFLLQFKINNAFKSLGRISKALSKRGEVLVDKKANEKRVIAESEEKVIGYTEQINTNELLAKTFETMAKALEKEVK